MKKILIIISFFLYTNSFSQVIPFGQGLTKKNISSFSFMYTTPRKVGSYMATGFFISYNNVTYFVTAKHCLFDSINLNKLRSDTTITISLREEVKKDYYLIYPINLKEAEIIHDGTIDIALITLKNDIPNKYKIFIDLKTNTPEKFIKGDSIKIVGFPHSNGYLTNTKPTFIKGLLVTNIMDNSKYNPDAQMTALSEHGASGSPVYGIKKINDKEVIDLLGVYHGASTTPTNGAFQTSYMIYFLLKKFNKIN